VRGEELVGFLHADVSGLLRGRSVPASELEQRLGAGVGWVPADQALTPFGPIAEPNPWGSAGDLRLLPDGARAPCSKTHSLSSKARLDTA
jgi:glutamine synthetase